MAKQKKALVATTQVVSLLDQMQKRISAVATRGGENSNTIAVLDTKIDNVTRNSAAGFVEQKKAIADNATGTTYVLNSLRSDTQQAFEAVEKDVKSAADCAQRHNARISKLEGDKDHTAIELVGVRCQQIAFDDRLAKLEAKTVPVVSTTTSSLETALKNLLKSYGYDVTSVGVSKSDYAGTVNNSGFINSTFNGSLQAISNRGSQHIEIKLNGYKSL